MALTKSWNAIKNSDSPIGTALWEGTKGLGRNTLNSYTNPYHGKPGFSLIGAGIGMGTGAMLGSIIPGGMGAVGGMGAGALVGGAALPVAGAFGALGVGALTTMYKNPIRTAGGFGGAGIMGGIGAAVGAVTGDPVIGASIGSASGAIAGAANPQMLGKAISGTAKNIAKPIGKGANHLSKAASRAALRYGDTALHFAGNLLKYTPEQVHFDEAKGKIVTKRGKLRLSKSGVAKAGLLAAPLLAPSLVNRGIEEVMDWKAGQNTGVTRATPSYLDNAGATGDLVFAMHQNRRG